ncbi:MAG TPA: hypothetical protein DCK87_01320 [Desulfotomaculum sp.]|nr:hypothetical protein [Desulfotomaculum sp.]
MPKSILIASLGKSPIVITAMVKALKEIKQINLDEVIVLYPEKAENIKDAFNIIEEQLKKVYSLPVTACSFPFSDVSTSGDCYHFLQGIYTILENNTTNTIYLSLAGGRKSMSVLMGVLVPFYRNVKGIYHILDKFEDDPKIKNFYLIETLIEYYIDNEDLLRQKMFPPLESLNLIELPFEYYANADELIYRIYGTRSYQALPFA